MTDRELLAQYAARGSHDAFAEIVRRHSRMVYATCLRILSNEHAAEDAAQATFIVLMKKASSISSGTVLSGWLFRTARHSALLVRKKAARRAKHEQEAAVMRAKEQERSGQSSWDEIRPHVDDALGALPKKQQDVVVLRYLQGMSEAEAARELRCPQGTVSVRLSRALKKLRSRLRRKGFGVGGAALVSFLEANTAEAAPVHLMASITAAGAAGSAGAIAAAGSAGAIAAGGAAAAIAKGVMTMMMWAKVKTAAIAVGIAAALGAGVPVAINAVNGAEEPAPMNAGKGAQAAISEGAHAADFGTIDFRIEPFQEQNQSLTIHANGTCVYKNEGRPGNLHDPKGLPAKTYEHTLGKDQVARLEALLRKTKWLTHPGVVSRATRMHSSKVTITLLRAGETRRVICEGPQPDPYHALVWLSRCLSRQENNLYLLQWANDDKRRHVCRDLASEIDALRGVSGRIYPIFDIDYRRYVREFRRALDNPEAYRDKPGDQLMAAIKVLSYIGDEESFGKIAQLALDRSIYVRRAAVDAMAHMGRPDHVPFLLKAAKEGSTSHYAAWAMIRMGDVAVPAIAGVLEANDTGLAYKLVRQYINHWDELPGPLDERVLQAVRTGMPKRGGPYDAYYGYVVDLARERPIEPVPMLGRLDYEELVRHKSSRFIHGWYTVVDGRIDRHAAAPRTDTSTDHLRLTVFKPEVQGGTLRCAAGWTAERWKHGRKPVPVQEIFEMPVPEGSLLETDHVYYKRKLPTGSGGNALRITKDYQVLWQGRVVSNGKTFLTLVYIGRLAEAADKEQRFVLPKQPLTYKRTPEFRR